MRSALRSGVARAVFLLVVAGCAWWGFRHSGDEIADSLAETSVLALVSALVLVLVGLATTGVLWRHVLAGYGHRLPMSQALSVFFVGQLGKYVPGSVWSMGVQARMAAVHQVPLRTTVATSLVFLVLHLATGLLVAAALGAGLDLGLVERVLLVGGCAVAGAVPLVPAVTRSLAARLAGGERRLRWGPRDTLRALGAMALVWTTYAAALLVVLPDARATDFVGVAVAFALGYVVGVAVPFAPAGLGAREAVFLAILVPLLGVGPAAALAVTGRVLHTVADFLAAGAAWWAARHAG